MVRKLKNNELNRPGVDEFRTSTKRPVVLVLDNVRSALNTGSVFRTADAFGLEGLYLCGITACPPANELRKTALGAEESVNWKYFERTADALHELREAGYAIIIIEQTDSGLLLGDWQAEPGRRYALVLGHEVNGVDEALLPLADSCLEIPQVGSKHSLNVAVSAGIVCWELFRQLR